MMMQMPQGETGQMCHLYMNFTPKGNQCNSENAEMQWLDAPSPRFHQNLKRDDMPPVTDEQTKQR